MLWRILRALLRGGLFAAQLWLLLGLFWSAWRLPATPIQALIWQGDAEAIGSAPFPVQRMVLSQVDVYALSEMLMEQTALAAVLVRKDSRGRIFVRLWRRRPVLILRSGSAAPIGVDASGVRVPLEAGVLAQPLPQIQVDSLTDPLALRRSLRLMHALDRAGWKATGWRADLRMPGVVGWSPRGGPELIFPREREVEALHLFQRLRAHSAQIFLGARRIDLVPAFHSESGWIPIER